MYSTPQPYFLRKLQKNSVYTRVYTVQFKRKSTRNHLFRLNLKKNVKNLK